MNLNKSVLMTGATGFLGSALLRRLLAERYQVTVLKRSFSNVWRIADLLSQVPYFDLDCSGMDEIAAKVRADYIIHCATDYGRRPVAVPEVIQTNLLLPVNLLTRCTEIGCRCFINTDTVIDKRVSVYSKSKNQFREWLDFFSADITTANIALEHFYGAGDDRSKFISYIMDKLLHDAPDIDLTMGEQKRDFVYIDDVVDAFMTLIPYLSEMPSGKHNFEIGSGELLSIREVVEKIKLLSGNRKTKLNFGALPYRENEIMASTSNHYAIRKLGWRPKYDFDAGISLAIANEREIMRRV